MCLLRQSHTVCSSRNATGTWSSFICCMQHVHLHYKLKATLCTANHVHVPTFQATSC
jgi:hypothetical protein